MFFNRPDEYPLRPELPPLGAQVDSDRRFSRGALAATHAKNDAIRTAAPGRRAVCVEGRGAESARDSLEQQGHAVFSFSCRSAG